MKKDKVYEVVANIPRGKVATYGQIARVAGIKSPRVVGNFLHQNPDPMKVPCHRIVNNKGMLAPKYVFGGIAAQKRNLIKEGIKVSENNQVDLSTYLWKK